MPPRVVRGEINASRSMARVSMLADLTFRALLVSVDDYGRCEADPLMLKAELFPRRREVTPEVVDGWIDELAAEGCIQRYEVEGVAYLQVTNWEKHRSNSKRAASSKFPDPPQDSRGAPGFPGDLRGSARLTSDECRVTSDEKERPAPSESPAAAGAPPPPGAVDSSPAEPEPEPEPAAEEPELLEPEPAEEPPPRARAKRAAVEREEPPEAVQFAADFAASIVGAHPSARDPTPSAMREWVREARLMLERDLRPLAEMQALAEWLFNAHDRDAVFWRKNVLSVPKFRQQYTKLEIARGSSNVRPIRQPRQGSIEDAFRNISADIDREFGRRSG